METLVIIGTGCAGLTAAIYAARAELRPLVLEGRQPGGQLTTTTLVENFPGFVDGIDGPELVMAMRAQAERFGSRFDFAEVTGFTPRDGYVSLELDNGDRTLDTRALIIASGAAARWLGLPREMELVGHGLTSCATCDGAFYRNVPVVVVGGGDSACEEATFLTRFASEVHLLHRRDKLRASKIMAERALSNPKIKPVWNAEITEYLTDAEGEMRGVRLRDTATGADRGELPVKCVFVAIGHEPNTRAFRGHLPTDPDGYLLTANTRGTATGTPGVFAAGDVTDRVYRQAITAAGTGCAAALDAERYLADMGFEEETHHVPPIEAARRAEEFVETAAAR